jgi:hypothetical protein
MPITKDTMARAKYKVDFRVVRFGSCPSFLVRVEEFSVKTLGFLFVEDAFCLGRLLISYPGFPAKKDSVFVFIYSAVFEGKSIAF